MRHLQRLKNISYVWLWRQHMINHTVSQRGWSCVWGCLVLWGVNPCCSSCLWWERVVQAFLSANTICMSEFYTWRWISLRRERLSHQCLKSPPIKHDCAERSPWDIGYWWIEPAMQDALQNQAFILVLLYTELSVKAAIMTLAGVMRENCLRETAPQIAGRVSHCAWRQHVNRNQISSQEEEFPLPRINQIILSPARAPPACTVSSQMSVYLEAVTNVE